MIKLTKEQALMFHVQLIEATGGCEGIRDERLLDSALKSPFQSFGGEELYPSIQYLMLLMARKNMTIFCSGYWNIRFEDAVKAQHPTYTEKYSFDRADGASYGISECYPIIQNRCDSTRISLSGISQLFH